MTRHLTLITGASRGLGRALAQDRLARGDQVLTLSRRAPELEVPAGAELLAWQADLANPEPLAAQLDTWLGALDPQAYASVTLIHNAGVMPKPAPLSEGDIAELSNALRVGLEAPLLLSAAFLHATAHWTVPRKLLLISSGLGRRAMAGSAAYSAAKAGMDHLARALALEEAARPNGAHVVSLAPGVIDTDMQAQLRGADPAQFPERSTFAGLHEQGLLDSPAQAAAKVLKLLDSDSFGSEPVADVRDPTAKLIAALGLNPHPEGGHYAEVFRSPQTVTPGDGRPARAALTTIDFLLGAGQFSAWHRVLSDEVWHLLEGEGLRLWLAPPDLSRFDAVELRPGGLRRHVVPAHWWQAAEPLAQLAYVGATVGPGFDFADFAFGRDNAALCAALPAELKRLL
jgi:benzil reductase ((S)-benzoin forming)